MKDLTGNTIEAGDRVAYAVRDGNTAILKLYTVIAVGEGCISAMADEGTRSSTLCKPECLLKVAHPHTDK